MKMSQSVSVDCIEWADNQGAMNIFCDNYGIYSGQSNQDSYQLG